MQMCTAVHAVIHRVKRGKLKPGIHASVCLLPRRAQSVFKNGTECSSAGEGVEIFFGELDYQEIESAGAFEVVVTKMGFLRSALSLTITPLTFDEFRRAGFSVPDERVFDELNTLDPAECKGTLLYTLI